MRKLKSLFTCTMNFLQMINSDPHFPGEIMKHNGSNLLHLFSNNSSNDKLLRHFMFLGKYFNEKYAFFTIREKLLMT